MSIEQTYNEQNIFWKIINQTIHTEIIGQTNHSLAFKDIHPKAKTHILVVPKGKYANYMHFLQEATPEEILDWQMLIKEIITNNNGFKSGNVSINLGSKQEIPHLHAHITLD